MKTKIILTAVLALWGIQASAQVPDGNFGMVGIGGGQTLRLNVVAYPPNPCNATIGFLGNAGQEPPNSPRKTVNLTAGQADFVDLPAVAVGIRVGQRAEFQPVVTLTPFEDQMSQCGVSAEIFDSATGLTW